MNFFEELTMIEHVAGGTSFLKGKDDQHPFFEPEINNNSYDDVHRRRLERSLHQEISEVERLSCEAAVILSLVKHGMLSYFEAYMKIVDNYPDILKYQQEILEVRPQLRSFFERILSF